MPGALPHLFAGCTLYLVGRLYYRNYYQEENITKERFLLFISCLFFTFIVDIVLIFHYLTNLFDIEVMWCLHSLVHNIFFFAAIVSLFIFSLSTKIKRKPIWIMGMWAIILHVIMDFFLPDTGIFY